jgi:hypothetical protein
MWKIKELSPLIKAFTWRLIRRALATGERAARYSTHIGKHCATCGAIEDDAISSSTVISLVRYGSLPTLPFELTVCLKNLMVYS